MSKRTRDIVILVVGLVVLLAAVLGGYAAVRARAAGSGASQVLAPVAPPSPLPSGASQPQYERWTAGVAQKPLTAYKRPDTSAPVVARLEQHTSADYPTVVLVDSIKSKGGQVWYHVWLPVPPNESRGWVKEGQLALYSTSSKIVIDLSKRKLYVYKRGALARSFPVAVGRPGLSTPTGTYFVTEKLVPPDPNGAYGALALGTSAFQPKLSYWEGGGQVGIHGTNEPWLIGKAISHGCVRMHNKDVKELSRLVPTGSPIEIVK
jgi:lipoprotein-anchoring transpeptidase ErfK/SrfK